MYCDTCVLGKVATCFEETGTAPNVKRVLTELDI
jgi:hypothetical protein